MLISSIIKTIERMEKQNILRSLRLSNNGRKRFLQQDGKCFLCNKDLDYSTNVDHLYPRSKGGMNNWSNKVLTHRACNELKADETPEAYMLKKIMHVAGVKWPTKYINEK